jgi:paraquat-inducible protein B
MTERKPTPASRATAKVERSRWPGWIWAIPIAVLLVVGWLGLRAITSGGEDITIVFDNANNLSQQNSNVVYRGTIVGRVSGVELAEDGNSVKVTANIYESAKRFLTSGTRFWLRGANPSLSDPSSLKAVLSGPTIVMEPGPGPKATHFTGLDRKPIAPPGNSHPQRYRAVFDGDVGALKRGDAVKLRGFTVGEIESIGFGFDAKTGAIQSPVTLVLYPSLLHIQGAPNSDSPEALRAAVSALVQKGLRARLERNPPLIGSYEISLDMVPGAPAASPAAVDGLPVMPTSPGGGLDSIVTRVNKVPVDQIAQNVLDVTQHIDTLVSSPELQDSIANLNQSLQQIQQVTAKAGPQITQLVDSLRKTADQLDRTARSTDKLVGSTTSQTGLNHTLQEVTDAARAVRELADYLDRHPEALLHGRSGGG